MSDNCKEMAVANSARYTRSMEFTILMPCLNEAETLEVCIKKASGWLAQEGVSGEVLIADNGSTDGSPEIAIKAGARLVNVSIRGYGAALSAGIRDARGKYVIMGDADDSYDFSNLSLFAQKLREGNTLVMGNRFKGGISPRAMPPLHRYLGNPVLTMIGRILFRSPCRDFHCGLRGFNREAILALDLRTTGMEFASEMVVKATLHKLSIVEVPTTLFPDGRSRPPHLRSWRDGWRHLRFLLMYSPGWRFMMPGIVSILVGLGIAAFLLPGPRTIEGVRLDLQTLLLGSALMIIGYQTVTFAIFTKTFAIEEKLLPPDPDFQVAFKYITLEWGLAMGGLLFFGGLILALGPVMEWNARSYGTLDIEVTMRIFLAGLTAMILGMQTIFASFFLSILGLRRKLD